MTIRALYSGVSGLQNFQTQLDVIGNNIANSQTVGFKSSRVTFQSLFYQTLEGASAPSSTNGGKNPKQIGLGSIISTIDQSFEQGLLQTTGRNHDLAIQGDGFFAVRDENADFYTRAGNFNFDSTGTLTFDGGFKVLGLNATNGILGSEIEPVQVPLGVTLPAQATQNVSLVGNLNASAQQIGTILQSEDFLAREVSGSATDVDGLFSTGAANSFVTGLVDGNTTVTVTTAGDSGTYTYSSSPVSAPATSLTFNTLDDLAAAIAADISDLSAVSLNSSGALEFTSGAASNTLTISSNLSVLNTALASSNVTSGFGVGSTTATDEFSHRPITTDLLVNLRDSSGTTLGLASGETITLDGDVGGTAVTQGTLSVSGTTTLGDLFDSLETTFNINTSNNVTSTNGRLVIGADGGTNYAISNVNITTSGTSTAFDAIFDNTTGNYQTSQVAQDNHVRSFTAYDSNGTAHTLTMKFNIRENAGNQTEYTVDISSVVTATGESDTSISPSTGTIIGNSDGSFSSFNFPTITITPVGVGDPIVINVDAGSANGFLGIVMFEGDSTASFSEADGYPSGELQDVTFSSDGIITGNFTNGQIQTLAQLQLAAFANPAGLESFKGVFRESNNSGVPVLDSPLVGQRGSLVVSTLEASNVDLANEFVTLITAQRGYQTNARIIRTADEILQELVNIV
ncbi:flagellar hook-basal body complex protein [bacterium]|nr:flagellar hook-basal body complex protein [bacterium]MCP5463110.1 flagellar hook-basal body complex protein [bacterium]